VTQRKQLFFSHSECHAKKKNVMVRFVCRAPSGNYDYLLNKLDNTLNSLHNYITEFIVSEVININDFATNNKKQQPDNPLATYNKTNTIQYNRCRRFPHKNRKYFNLNYR